MCGICGFYQVEKEADAGTLKKMNDQIVHRGPDDEGFFQKDAVGLAARRLSIIDLTTGHQPLCSRSGNSWITYNGEVYNFPELRRELDGRGYTFRSQSDTEVVVNLYEEFGLEFVKKLRGMFAFAIFDQKNQRLILARDHDRQKTPVLLPEKQRQPGLRLGDQSHPAVSRASSRDVDPEALDFFLTLEYVPAPYSILAAVKKLPAGHLLVYENGNAVELSEYLGRAGGRMPAAFAAAREEFLALLEESVRLRMISDVPLGAFLSGGIDSSAIVAMMAEDLARPDQDIFHRLRGKIIQRIALFAPGGRKIQDRPLAKKHCTPTSTTWFCNWPASWTSRWAIFPISPPTWCRALAREKVTVALSGDGGDEIFGGYEHYLAQKLARFIDPFAAAPAAGADRTGHAPAAALGVEKRAGQPQQALRRRLWQLRRPTATSAGCFF